MVKFWVFFIRDIFVGLKPHGLTQQPSLTTQRHGSSMTWLGSLLRWLCLLRWVQRRLEVAKGKLGIENTLGSSKLLPCLHCQERWLIKASWCYTNFCFFLGGKGEKQASPSYSEWWFLFLNHFGLSFPYLRWTRFGRTFPRRSTDNAIANCFRLAWWGGKMPIDIQLFQVNTTHMMYHKQRVWLLEVLWLGSSWLALNKKN